MQLRLISPSYNRRPQRVNPVEGSQPAGEDSQQRANHAVLARIPADESSEYARRQYYYTRVKAVAGRTAQALKSYSDIEDGFKHEQLRAQFGLDLFA